MTRATKAEKIIIDNYGSFIGANRISFVVNKDKKQVQSTPFYKVSEIVIPCGNAISTTALFWANVYNIDVLLVSPLGKPLATFRPIKSDSHVKTRICQYEAYRNRKGVEIAKQFILGKIEAQSQILQKHELEPFESLQLPSKEQIERLYGENVDSIRLKLQTIESHYTQHYFGQIFKLFPKHLRIEQRDTFGAYEPLNNLLNLAYEILTWKVFRAITKTRLEPYLGFIHSMQKDKPSLVCDLQDLYRPYIDNFLIQYTKTLNQKDFTPTYGKAKTPRMFLKYPESSQLIKALNNFFETKVEIQRIKKHGSSQTLETLMNEEALLLAMYIRNETPAWNPRTPTPLVVCALTKTRAHMSTKRHILEQKRTPNLLYHRKTSPNQT